MNEHIIWSMICHGRTEHLRDPMRQLAAAMTAILVPVNVDDYRVCIVSHPSIIDDILFLHVLAGKRYFELTQIVQHDGFWVNLSTKRPLFVLPDVTARLQQARLAMDVVFD